MAGCYPIPHDAIPFIISNILGQHCRRNRAMFVFQLFTGFRAQEVLSLNIGDVWRNGRLLDYITVHKRNMKGKKRSRDVIMHDAVKSFLIDWLKVVRRQGNLKPDIPLFYSLQYAKTKSTVGFASSKLIPHRLTTRQMRRIYNKAYRRVGLHLKHATHGIRKTWFNQFYKDADGEIHLTAEMGGHQKVTSTQSYLTVERDRGHTLVKQMAFSGFGSGPMETSF